MTSRRSTHVLVMAKAPVAGAVKTRLMPTFSASDAAAVARAALEDTLDAVRATKADRRIVAMAGGPIPHDACHACEVILQEGATFNDRLAEAWRYAGTPGLQIGMDTPQVTPELLDAALTQLIDGSDDAVLGMAPDGGWWAIGFRTHCPGAFSGVRMSEADTGAQQLARLRAIGLRVGLLPELQDVDLPSDLAAIAAAYPHLRTAKAAGATAVAPVA